VSSTHFLAESVVRIDGVEALLPGVPFARDVAVVTPAPAAVVLDRLAEEGFLGGLALDSLTDEGDGSIAPDARAHTILMSATERRTLAEVESFAAAFEKAAR